MSYSEETDTGTQIRRIVIAVVVVLLLIGGVWWWLKRPVDTEFKPEFTMTTVPEAEPPPLAEPAAIQYPIEPEPEPEAEVPAEQPTAPAVNPDALVESSLREVFAGKLAEWLISDKLMRRLVATIDNLPNNVRIEPLRPLRPPSEPFAVERETLDAVAGTERITISPDNTARYDGLVALFANVDTATAVAAYRRIYPQLQQTYEDLGYPGRYFNDRVVQVIDHLLATPEPQGPIVLEQPKVLYRFADATLESRSAGQKLLLRIGVDHERKVKTKLREIRAQLVSKE